MEKKEDGKIVLNTPVGLNLELLFADKSIAFKPKAEFLIHQTNYFDKQGGYQINSTNHSSFFGIKKGDLALIIRRLIDAGVIKKVKNYSPGNTSNTYQMVQPFDNATSQKSFYRPDEILFLKKWVADDYIVKNPSDSKFVKTTKRVTMASLQKENNQLKALLFDVVGKLNPNVPPTLPIDNCEQDAVPDSPASTDITISEGQPGIQSTTIDVSVKADFLTNEEDVTMPLSVDDTAVSTDLSAADLEALDELLLVFDGDDTPDIKEETQLLPMTEIISATETLDVKEEEQVEQTLGFDAKLQSTETYETKINLTDTLETVPYEDTMCIVYNDEIGCIVNFPEIEIWCSQMSKGEKQDFYCDLMTSKGTISKVQVNKHTKVQFAREETKNGLIFTYQTMIAA